MPINWKAQENQDRLVSAIIAAHTGLKLSYSEIAKYFGPPATYDSIETHLRPIRREASLLKAQVDSGFLPAGKPKSLYTGRGRTVKASQANDHASKKRKLDDGGTTIVKSAGNGKSNTGLSAGIREEAQKLPPLKAANLQQKHPQVDSIQKLFDGDDTTNTSESEDTNEDEEEEDDINEKDVNQPTTSRVMVTPEPQTRLLKTAAANTSHALSGYPTPSKTPSRHNTTTTTKPNINSSSPSATRKRDTTALSTTDRDRERDKYRNVDVGKQKPSNAKRTQTPANVEIIDLASDDEDKNESTAVTAKTVSKPVSKPAGIRSERKILPANATRREESQEADGDEVEVEVGAGSEHEAREKELQRIKVEEYEQLRARYHQTPESEDEYD